MTLRYYGTMEDKDKKTTLHLLYINGFNEMVIVLTYIRNMYEMVCHKEFAIHIWGYSLPVIAHILKYGVWECGCVYCKAAPMAYVEATILNRHCAVTLIKL